MVAVDDAKVRGDTFMAKKIKFILVTNIAILEFGYTSKIENNQVYLFQFEKNDSILQ